MSPREFEFFVAELFSREGYNVSVTQQTRDGGKDILIIEKKMIGNFLIYVECKKNAPNRPVGVNVVRSLHGVVDADRATAGIIVSSSYFSDKAKEFTDKIQYKMSLLDYIRLTEWINKLSK